MVENTVWAIGEIGTDDQSILEEIAQLLSKEGQIYRVIIQTLAKHDYQPALERIAPLGAAAPAYELKKHSLLPIPYSLFPVPYSLLPAPCSLVS